MGDEDDGLRHGSGRPGLRIGACAKAPRCAAPLPYLGTATSSAQGESEQMPVIVIANPKGGVGKSTLATNAAGGLAAAGRAVMLGDVDRQQSARRWLSRRPPQLAPIRGWDATAADRLRPPPGTTHVVIDTPAGLHGKRLDTVLRIADRVLIPLQPSLFDIQATHEFVQQLMAHPRAGHIRTGLVAMRVRDHTIAFDQLQQYLATLEVPLVAALRDTQNYVQLAARGATLWDVAPSRVERDLVQWAPLLAWLH
jgi:chromosome partitioning protein